MFNVKKIMNKKFSDFYVGQIATFNKVFEENDFEKFSEISGDNNLYIGIKISQKYIF